MAVNVSVTASFLRFDGNYQPGEYDVTVTAHTASYSSMQAKATVNVAQTGKSLSNNEPVK